MKLTHINEQNRPTMVDVSSKNETSRVAVASGEISMSKSAYEAVLNESGKKGPVLDTAIIAAIMGAKKTSEIVPMCHPIMLSKVDCEVVMSENLGDFVIDSTHKSNDRRTIKLIVTAKCDGKTGVEMEALSGVSIGLLTIYDMLKAIDKSMVISNITLEAKRGGKSGDYARNANVL